MGLTGLPGPTWYPGKPGNQTHWICVENREKRLEKQKSIMPENKDFGTCVLIYNVQIIIVLSSRIIIRVKQVH